ncbi:JAB domain-containing protein [Kaistella sp. 97-N-M2]|uniref:JAB domain-containing protein n=1 Tax=Kaistella sp. 97-N-M2 TaxID=2908645 RepID=UPI001F21EADB|nr:JAB domain-containing protein [Kaistella sp. 97-N-M2]UJF29915.1 JAB domain-containing protein [Kaistella sp. 97-N-M2]
MTTYLQEIKLTLSKTEEHPVKYETISGSREAAEIFRTLFADEIGIFESVFVIYLNQKNVPIGWRKISQGGISSSIVDVRLVLVPALNCLASGFIICHNHPSGNLRPSEEDRKITKQLQEVGQIMSVKLLDHLILTETNFFSFADEGLI